MSTPALRAQAQVPESSMTVSDGRPLMMAVVALQQRVDIPINFEEIAYEYPNDLITTNAKNKSGKSLVGPRGGEFSFTLPASTTDAYLAVQTVVSQYMNSGLPGSYRVIRRNESIDILPISKKTASGSLQNVASVLEQVVDVPTSTRSFDEAFNLILASASQMSGTKLRVARIPLFRDTVTFGAMNLPFSEALDELYQKVGKAKMSTLLIYEPTEGTYYVTVSPLPPHAAYRAPQPGTPTVVPKVGPVNSPFFTKQ